jgi:hypothetical protein
MISARRFNQPEGWQLKLGCKIAHANNSKRNIRNSFRVLSLDKDMLVWK